MTDRNLEGEGIASESRHSTATGGAPLHGAERGPVPYDGGPLAKDSMINSDAPSLSKTNLSRSETQILKGATDAHPFPRSSTNEVPEPAAPLHLPTYEDGELDALEDYDLARKGWD